MGGGNGWKRINGRAAEVVDRIMSVILENKLLRAIVKKLKSTEKINTEVKRILLNAMAKNGLDKWKLCSKIKRVQK